MKINCAYDELVPVRDLKPHPKNPNKHPAEQIERLAKILQYQGWRKPITVSNLSGCITAGHGRLLAAKLLGEKTVPVDYQDYKDTDQELADLSADNSIAAWAEIDMGMINAMIPDLGPDFDLELLGFEDLKLDPSELGNEGLTDPDEVPEVSESITKPGDLWQLGEHRLLCGDCTDKANIDRLMNGEKADMVFTDPPYNCNFDGKYDDVYKSTKGVNTIDKTKEWDSNFVVTEKALPNAIEVSSEKANYIIFTGWYPFWRYVFPFFHDKGNEWAAKPFIWCKKFAMSNVRGTSLANATEPAILAYRKGHKWNSKVGTENYDWKDFSSNEGGRSYEHPTAKPIALCTHLITFGDLGDTVLDPFLGSGSTLIACEKTGRKCYGMEIDPHYCDVIIKRWEDYTGGKAELESS